jgi:hypothetical protein
MGSKRTKRFGRGRRRRKRSTSKKGKKENIAIASAVKS